MLLKRVHQDQLALPLAYSILTASGHMLGTKPWLAPCFYAVLPSLASLKTTGTSGRYWTIKSITISLLFKYCISFKNPQIFMAKYFLGESYSSSVQ